MKVTTVVLTNREAELYRLLMKNGSLKQIAPQMGLTVGTAKVYANRIYFKLRVEGRVGLLVRENESLRSLAEWQRT
jgi:LuxR family transcriptional regulator, maltose regulon positive regulatory protein